MQSHSIFHTSGKARCTTPWDKMPGTDSIRTCPDCNAVFYRFGDRNQEDAIELVRQTEHFTGDVPHLYFRKDGSFTTSNRHCQILQMPASNFTDFFESFSLVYTVCRGSIGLFLSMVMLYTFPHLLLGYNAGLATLVSWLSTLVCSVLILILQCRIVRARVQIIEGNSLSVRNTDRQLLGTLWITSLSYGLLVYFGFLLLIVGGFINGLRGCMAMVYVLVDGRTPKEALDASWKVTDKKVNYVWHYMLLPIATYFVGIGLTIMINMLLFAVKGSIPALFTALSIISIAFAQAFCVFVFCLFVPLQVNLYYRLRQRPLEIESAPSVPQ